MPATGADRWIIKTKTDMIEHSANDRNTWMVRAVIMVAVAGQVRSSRIPGHRIDTVAFHHDSMDASKLTISIYAFLYICYRITIKFTFFFQKLTNVNANTNEMIHFGSKDTHIHTLREIHTHMY